MKILFIDDAEHTGDEIPQQITAIYDTEEGFDLHVTLTEEGLIVDVVHGNSVEATGAYDVPALLALTDWVDS